MLSPVVYQGSRQGGLHCFFLKLRSCGARSIPTAEIRVSLPIAALIPIWNLGDWEVKRREGKMQSQATHFHGQ